MEFRKYHLFFSCGTMKFSLFLLFLLLLFDSPQGSTISHKRSIRALNTTLETNFNGTYERRNPCTNAEIETTSYVASHEFRHHTEENNWSDYTHKCSSIISSFLKALGNLVCFNHKQNGIFNFRINTSISQKQDGHCDPGKGTICDTLPTITIAATDCELSPRLPCQNRSGEQFSPDENKGREDAIGGNLLNEEIYGRNQTAPEKALRTSNFNQNAAVTTPHCRTEDEMTLMPSLDAFTEKLPQTENVWTLDDIFLPATETITSPEPEFATASTLMRTENSPQAIIELSESAQTNCQSESYPELFKSSVTPASQLDSENYSQGTESSTPVDPKKLKIKASESFHEQSPSHRNYLSKTSYFAQETTPQPTVNEEPFYPNQFSDMPLREQQPAAYSEELFNDNLDRQVPDIEFLPNQQPDNSFILPDQIPKTRFSPQEPIPAEIYKPKNSAFEVNPFSLRQQVPITVRQKQSLQSGKQPDNFEKTQTLPNSDISSETRITSFPFQSDLTEYEEASLNKISNVEPQQIPNFTPLERQFVDYDDQTPESYPIPPAQAPSIKNTPDSTFADQYSNKFPKERAQAMDYPGEFFTTQSALESNLDFLTTENTFSPNNDQSVSKPDDYLTFNIRKPVNIPPTWTSDVLLPKEKPFYEGDENRFFSTPPSERPPFDVANESRELTSETQKSVPNYSEENPDDNSTDKVTHAESSLPSDQYQSTTRPESQALLNYPDQYDDIDKIKSIPESGFFDRFVQPDSELTTDEPYLQPYSSTTENQANIFTPYGERPSPLRYSTSIVSNQKFSPSYDSSSDYESFSPSEGETFSDEYLTTLPPEEDSFENSQKILTTFDPYQDEPKQTLFPSTLEGKFASTFSDQTLNEDAISPTPAPAPDASTVSSQQSSSDIYISHTPASTSFDDYQDSSFSKPNVEPSFTTPMQHFNEDTYEPTTETYVTNDQNIYSEESQPTTSTIFGFDELEQQASSYSNQNSDLTLEQPLNYASDTLLPSQNYDSSKVPPQFFGQREESRPDVKPFSDQHFNNLPTESSKVESFMKYDSKQQPDSFPPQMEQYADENVLISDQSKQNSNNIPYFVEDFPQESQTTFSPQPFMPFENEGLSPGKASFENVENTSSRDFSTGDDYFEPITTNNYQKSDQPVEFFKDSDTRSEKFAFESFTTPVPPFSFPSESFSSPSNYKTTSGNSLTQTQVEESVEQSTDEGLPSQFEEPALPFSVLFRGENKFDSDFQNEENLKQPSEPATTGEEPRRSTIPVYESESDQPSSFFDAIEPFTPYAENQYFPADQPKVEAVFLPEQEPFPKPLSDDLPEYDSTTSSEYQPTEEPAETEINNYSVDDSDNSESLPAVNQQTGEITDQDTANSNRFPDFYPKEPSTDLIPSADLPLTQNFHDSPKKQTEFYSNNRQPSSVVFEPQSLMPATASDQSRSLELQSSSSRDSVLPFSDDKSSAVFSEKTPLDFPLQTNSLGLKKRQELQSKDFKTSDPSGLYNQPQVTSYTSYPPKDFSKDSQSFSVEDLDSVILPESRLPKPETHRNMNRAPNRQAAAKFNVFQSPQRELESYKPFRSSAPLQLTKFKNKGVVPTSDYSPSLKSKSQIEPSVYDYNKQVFNPHSAPKPQFYRYQPELSLPTLLEEYSHVTPTEETEIPFDIDETTASPLPEASPSYINEQSESQYVQEKISDYSSLTPEQLKPQPSYDYLLGVSGENMAERTILSAPQTSNFENIPFFEEQSDKSVASDSYTVYKEAYEQETANTDYNQPESKESDYLDESSTTNFDEQTPYLNNPVQSSTSPPFDSVPDVQSKPNDLMFFSQSPSSESYQLNNNSDEPTQQSSDILLSYPPKTQSEEEISFVTDKISPQLRPTTAVYNDEKITEMPPTSKPQPQTSLGFTEEFSDDRIPEQLSDSPNQRYQITPDAALPPEFEPVPSMSLPYVSSQSNTPDFDSSDNDANNQSPFLLQSRAQELDTMTGSLDQIQNNFDSKVSPEIPNAPIIPNAPNINPERPNNNQEQFSSYNQYEPQPIVDSNNQPVSVKYQQEPFFPPVVYDRFFSNVSPQEQRYFNEAFPSSEAQRVTASKYDQLDLDPREKFQAQPPYLPNYPNDAPFLNNEKNRFRSVVSRHSATQRFEPQPYPRNFPNQYPHSNPRPRPNIPTRNFYNNEPARQTNRASPQYFTNEAMQAENSFKRPLPFNLDQYSKGPEVESSPDQTIKNANSPSYDDYDQVLSSQLPNEKLLEYDEGITPNLYSKNSQMIQAQRQQGRDMIEDPHESSDDFLTEADPPLGFNRKADPYDFPDISSPNNVPPSFPSPPVEQDPDSNPLLQTLETHLIFPFHEHLHPSDSEKDSLNDRESFDPKNQKEFRDASAVPPSYSKRRNPELDFLSHQRSSQPLNGVDTAQDITNTRQPDSQALISDPNIPSNKPGEDCVSCSGQNPTPLLCPFDPILKGNMTAPSYYILISKLPVDDDKEEQFKVEKVYLGDGMPLNCTLIAGKTFPTSLYTPIPFSAAGAVKLRTKSDFA